MTSVQNAAQDSDQNADQAGSESDGAGESKLVIERDPRGLIIRLREGELTMFDLPEVRAEVTPLLAEKPAALVLDLAQTSYLDSSAIGWIFKLRTEIVAYNGRLCLSALRPALQRVMSAVVKNREIEFYDSVEQALTGA